MQSICDQLLFEQAKGRRQLKQIKFIWTDRDPVMMEEAPVVRRSSSVVFSDISTQQVIDMEAGETNGPSSTDAHNSAQIFTQLLTLLPPGQATDQELEQLYESLDVLMELDADRLDVGDDARSTGTVAEEDDENLSHADDITSGLETTLADNLEPWDFEDPEKLGEILDMQLYMTDKRQTDFNLPNARFGRPDLKQIFLDMKEDAKAKGEKRIAVCVCAPQKLSAICRKACIVYSDKQVRFDFHTESMDA
jgi:hypothetical protein